MTSRRISSRRVVLTTTFLALAAGGIAACDSTTEDEWVTGDSGTVSYGDAFGESYDESYEVSPQEQTVEDEAVEDEEAGDEVFYCADEGGEIVEAENCDDGASANGVFFLWHSTGYPRGLKPGAVLADGDYFEPGDKSSRRAFKLPAAGRVTNGTVKTNVVGRGSSGSSVSGGSMSSGS